MKTLFRAHNQKGFLLVSALMILLLLVAVSSIVFLVSTKDLRISGRIQGEKLAYAAAEGGLQLLLRCGNANKDFIVCNFASQQVTAANPFMLYTVVDHTIATDANDAALLAQAPKQVSCPGYPASTVALVRNKTITGTDTRFGTTVVTDVGVAYCGASSLPVPY